MLDVASGAVSGVEVSVPCTPKSTAVLIICEETKVVEVTVVIPSSFSSVLVSKLDWTIANVPLF